MLQSSQSRKLYSFGRKQKISTDHFKDCVSKLENFFFEEWRKLQKSGMRYINQSIKKQNRSLDDLISISHQDELKNIKEENREILLL